MNRNKALSDMNVGEKGVVESVDPESNLFARLLDMGLIEGTQVECVGKSPGGDPSAYLVRGAVIAIRKRDAKAVCVCLKGA